MNSRVSWSVDGIDPAVRERAEAAAQRAGMSLGDWINSQVGDPPRQLRPSYDPPPAPRPMAAKDADEVADIHARLDSITRQIETISTPAPRGDQGVARQLNDAISRLDARLTQIGDPASRTAEQREQQTRTDRVERAAASVYQPSPPLNPGSLDLAIAEIVARQNELDAAPVLAPRAAPPIAPAMSPATAPSSPAAPDMMGLERHLAKITSQIEALQHRPDTVEQSITAFRAELADIRRAITEAMPRRAIESLESDIRALARRIDDGRHSGIDAQALAGVEHALGEIRQALLSLTPAENLAGFEDTIRNFGGKIDAIVRASHDPGTLRQLEDAIAALRGVVSNVASTSALAELRGDVQTLSSKVDQLARSEGGSETFTALEQRIAALTVSLETRERPSASATSEHLESAVRALSDRLDRLPVGNDSSAALAHLEQRVSFLLERLESTTTQRPAGLSRVEEGLQDVLLHLERQQDHFVTLADDSRRAPPPPAIDLSAIDELKREISDMRFSRSDADRSTQDSLEAVHNTLGHVVDRLAMIEGDLRTVRAAPPQPPMQQPAPEPVRAPLPMAVLELPNPAAEQFDAAPRQFAAKPAIETKAQRSLQDILDPPGASLAPASRDDEDRLQPRLAIDPDLPPDHPLEPGSRPLGRLATPSERIAASENAIAGIAVGTSGKEHNSTSSFIAAARRAAQAATVAAPPPERARSGATKPAKAAKGAASAEGPSTIGSKIRSLLVGASVVIIVLGSFKMAMTMLDGLSGSAPVADSAMDGKAPATAPPAIVIEPSAPPPAQAPVAPSLTSPTPIGRQSLNTPPPGEPMTLASADVTGTIAAAPVAASRPAGLVAIPASETLPEAIGGPLLRAAALRGDPAAAYEIGVRFADGKGVAANLDEAAKWYDRAAQAGVVPAIFRVGALYEKGLGLKKDIDAARRYYVLAAERGNAKAMHNLAVLDADGGSKGANYKSASQWFRKAAERGVADSQFNLGILYARGIGVEQNLAESFKWFSLAAAQGDADAGRKRDDVAKRLDPQSLSAAKLAIQTFTPEPQPDDAVNAGGPAGGWDSAPASASKPPAPKPAAKRASR